MTDIITATKATKQFVNDWLNRGDENQDTQNYWNQLLRTVYGVEVPEQYIQYEKPVAKGFIDGYIADTKVLIEQKSMKYDLDAKEPRQGKMMTPYEQAHNYVSQLALQEKPAYIITCNFQQIRIYDCRIQPKYDRKTDTWYAPYEEIQLADLPNEFRRLGFLANVRDRNIKKEMEVSVKAGEVVGLIYDKLLGQYNNPEDEETLKSLNQLCVRLVFCFYAEDAGVFDENNTSAFYDYMKSHRNDARSALIRLFKILDTKEEDRDPYEDEDLLSFPYVNGGLFSDSKIIIPRLTPEIIDLILEKASEEFDWSGISPTIFGACFESSLNPETRRAGGMHYTSIENIHKVIDPLFLDDLKIELEKIISIPVARKRERKLREFQDKLASLKFLDPAAGSGNFLTETYLSLRRLENKLLEELYGQQMMLVDMENNPIKVSINQFYGIEINDFAVTVAKTALWIAELQMLKETELLMYSHLDLLPLKSFNQIYEGNALRMDWNEVLPSEECYRIYGNPPFIGYSNQSKDQKEDCKNIFKGNKKSGKLDYVACWYRKTFEYMSQSSQSAFVSTNSICQGEQVTTLWKDLFQEGLEIDFCYHSFKWNSESQNQAQVSVIIIGFSKEKHNKYIYDNENKISAQNINAYLMDAENIFVEARRTPICDVIPAVRGFQPTDGGYLIMGQEEYMAIKNDYNILKWIRPFSMGGDFIKGVKRYCLWLDGISPKEIKNCPFIKDRLEKLKAYRYSAPVKGDAYKLKDSIMFRPAHGVNINMPYIAIPQTSSANRRYIPIDFVKTGMIPGNGLNLITNGSIYDFGILVSNIHMAWMRVVALRFGNDGYRYIATVVYNNFPWPSPTETQKENIEKTAQNILDARALYPDSSLADLYDPLTMPPELLKAHQANDKAVMEAYGIKKGDPEYSNESACVAMLMKMYKNLTEQKGEILN